VWDSWRQYRAGGGETLGHRYQVSGGAMFSRMQRSIRFHAGIFGLVQTRRCPELRYKIDEKARLDR